MKATAKRKLSFSGCKTTTLINEVEELKHVLFGSLRYVITNRNVTKKKIMKLLNGKKISPDIINPSVTGKRAPRKQKRNGEIINESKSTLDCTLDTSTLSTMDESLSCIKIRETYMYLWSMVSLLLSN